MAKKANSKKKGTNHNANHKGNGDFAKGNTAAKGHSTKEQKKAKDFKRAFQNAVTYADLMAIAKKMIKLAKGGNVQAAKDVLDRCLGKPTETHEIGGIDGGPIQVSIVDFGKIDDDTEA